jgi:hypothetical protein
MSSDAEKEISSQGRLRPISERKLRAMTNKLDKLIQEIIEFADPESCRTLLKDLKPCYGALRTWASEEEVSAVAATLEYAQTFFAERKRLATPDRIPDLPSLIRGLQTRSV